MRHHATISYVLPVLCCICIYSAPLTGETYVQRADYEVFLRVNGTYAKATGF
ncbi:MAG: hypothetical protein ACTTJ7_00720 [Treponema sp.]